MSPLLVCIHSFTAHGWLGLKPFVEVLGDRTIPIPSLLLTGPGNMTNCRRFDYDFETMLNGTLSALADQQRRAWVFVGYVARPAQIALIERALTRHSQVIEGVLVDPVCGDNGQAYVAPELVAAWPRLLQRAQWALPNLTEVELISGAKGDAGVAAFRRAFPNTHLIVTGCFMQDEVATDLWAVHAPLFRHRQRRVGAGVSGTGDHFAAVFARALLFERQPAPAAVSDAATSVARRLQQTHTATSAGAACPA